MNKDTAAQRPDQRMTVHNHEVLVGATVLNKLFSATARHRIGDGGGQLSPFGSVWIVWSVVGDELLQFLGKNGAPGSYRWAEWKSSRIGAPPA